MAVTREQALTENEFHYGECVRTHGPRGGINEEIVQWRRNGATKTWKREPDRFQVPVKYGMRDYSYLDDTNADEFHVARECPLEGTEYRRVLDDGRIIEIEKRGGGTLGRKYEGDWSVNVTDQAGRPVLDYEKLRTAPRTHAEAAEIVLEILDGEG